jgi:hypothetical protein
VVVDEFVKHLAHRPRIPAHDGVRGHNVALSVEALPDERAPGVRGKLLEECALRPAVAFPERMNGVDLAQVIGHPVDEDVTGEPLQELLLAQLTEDLGCTGSMNWGRQNMLPFAMATVRTCPAQS